MSVRLQDYYKIYERISMMKFFGRVGHDDVRNSLLDFGGFPKPRNAFLIR